MRSFVRGRVIHPRAMPVIQQRSDRPIYSPKALPLFGLSLRRSSRLTGELGLPSAGLYHRLLQDRLLTGWLTQAFERVRDCILQSVRAISAEVVVDLFETADEIENFATCDRAAGGGAKMCAAAEWAIVVDEAIAGGRVEHGTGAIRIFRERFAAGGAKCARGDDRFAFRQVRSATGQFKMATFGLARAVPLNRTLRKIDIDLAHFGDCALQRLPVHDFGSTPAMACPAIQPVVQAAWKLKPPVMPSMSSSSPAK